MCRSAKQKEPSRTLRAKSIRYYRARRVRAFTFSTEYRHNEYSVKGGAKTKKVCDRLMPLDMRAESAFSTNELPLILTISMYTHKFIFLYMPHFPFRYPACRQVGPRGNERTTSNNNASKEERNQSEVKRSILSICLFESVWMLLCC